MINCQMIQIDHELDNLINFEPVISSVVTFESFVFVRPLDNALKCVFE